MTIPTITNGNLFLLLPGKISAVAQLIAEEKHISSMQALHDFYCSETYYKLENEETKFWHLGNVALYEEFLEENNKKQKI